jgi:hypothetical protein
MNPHEPGTAISDSPLQLRPAERSVRRSVTTIILGTVLLLATGLAVERITGGGGLFFDKDYDHVSEKQLRDRQQAYTVALPVQLAPVSPEDTAKAIASMELSAEQGKALLTELQPKEAAREVASSTPVQTHVDPTSTSVQGDKQPLQLAWITLWDTDTEDADTVRLTSGDYSRIVTLTNHPVTFAVPMPPTGIIHVTGVHDGGGGITVGISSGSTPVALPLMSEGQAIGIPIAIR